MRTVTKTERLGIVGLPSSSSSSIYVWVGFCRDGNGPLKTGFAGARTFARAKLYITFLIFMK